MNIIIMILCLISGIAIGFIGAWTWCKVNYSAMEAQLQAANEQKAQTEFTLKEQLLKTEQALQQQSAQVLKLTSSLAAAETDKQNLQERVEKQMQETAEMQKRLTTEFENIANKVLQHRQAEFTEHNRRQIDDILRPLNDKIKDFRDQISNAFSQETREKASLQAELRQLMELNQTLSKDAVNLTNALKGDIKKQGNWGELVLERVLEASGLRKGEEYEREVVMQGAGGEDLRADVVVHLPDNKHIIIDSKVSLVAYEQMNSSDNEDDYNRHLKEHIASLKSQVKILYEKQYQRAGGLNTPDFVLMFVPIEASYTIALQAEPKLYDYALEKKIVIVSPTTLLATLHTISYVWRQENQNRNAQEIARLAGAMYDKLSGLIEDFRKVQRNLDMAQKAYNDTFNKLSEGKGNVLRTAEKIRELGAKTSKSLPISEEE